MPVSWSFLGFSMWFFKFFTWIKSSFGIISKSTGRFLDLAGKFDKDEIVSLMDTMNSKKMGLFKRHKTLIVSEEGLKYLKKQEAESVTDSIAI